MPRPKVKDEQITIKLKSSEKAIIKKYAKENNTTITNVLIDYIKTLK